MPTDLTTRIKNIQKQLALQQIGLIDLDTCISIEGRLNIKVSGTSTSVHVKKIQKALSLTDDGIAGPMTISRIESLINTTLPAIPAGANMAVSAKSLELVIASEITSKEVYLKKYQSPIWAGGASGVTIGIGYDCGYCSKQEFTTAWKELLSATAFSALIATCGKAGEKCKAMIPVLGHIKIPYDIAIRIFYQVTLPACARDVKKIYPGVEKLPPDAQGALLSLIYNRGPLIDNSDRRKEMKAIVPLVAAGNLTAIAQELSNMKRLWDPARQKGLVIRRGKEAQLVAQAVFNTLPENLVMV